MGTNPTTVKSIVDAGTWSKYPTTNYSNVARNGLGNGAGNISELFLYWARPFPIGVTILSAKLVFYNTNAWSGSVTINAQRTTAKWDSTRLTYNNKPGVGGTVYSLTKASPAANTRWEIDVTGMMQTVSSGGVWYGIRLTTTSTVYNWLHSPQATTVDYRPVLIITWSDAPKAPTVLSPSNGRAVSTSKPTLSFNFTDLSGDTTMQACQVQINPTNAFTAPAFDSGTVLTSVPELDLNTTAYAGLAADATAWWRVRVQDGAGLWSDWSVPTSFTRKLKLTLTLNNPPSGIIRTNLEPNPTYRYNPGSTAVVRTNNVLNPALTSNATGYSSNSGGGNTSTATREVAGGPTVNGVVLNFYRMTLTSVAGTTSQNGVGLLMGSAGSAQIAVTPSTPNTYSFHARTSVARPMYLNVQYYDASGAAVGSLTQILTLTTTAATWQRWSVTDTPPANAAWALFRLYGNGSTPAIAVADTFDVTGVLAESGMSFVGDYFDGAAPAATRTGWLHRWTGTAGASTSEEYGSVGGGTVRAYSTHSHFGAYVAGSDVYEFISKRGYIGSNTIMAWHDSSPFPAVVAGAYYAFRLKARSTSGSSVIVNPRMAVYAPTNVGWLTSTTQTVTLPADGSWVDVVVPSLTPVASGLTSPTARILLYADSSEVAGTSVQLKEILVEAVSGASVSPGAYFDGDTGDVLDSMDYSWAGTANASSSNLTRSYVQEATPIIDWTAAGNGRTQKAYAVTITDAEQTEKRLWTSGKVTSTVTAITVPAGVLKTNLEDYRVVVAIWDEIDREATPGDTPYVGVSRTFQFLYDSTVDPASSITAVAHSMYPWAVLTFTRATMPDKWNLYRNGRLIKTVNGQDLIQPGTTTYKYTDLLPEPRQTTTYMAIPVVNGKGASGNPSASVVVTPMSVTLSDDSGLTPVIILNPNWDADLQEESELFAPAASGPPILITQAERGFQGKVEGRLSDIGTLTSDTFLKNYKSLIKYNGQKLFLTLVNNSFECFIRNATYRPIAGPGWTDAIVSFEFYQTDYVE